MNLCPNISLTIVQILEKKRKEKHDKCTSVHLTGAQQEKKNTARYT